jgi:putative membrane protein
MLAISDLPLLNAALNFTSAVLITTGYYFIRKRRVQAHKACMVAALIVSAAFLASYLTYHYFAGSVPYTKQDWTRPIYFFILPTHIVLAAAIVPLVLRTVYLAFRNRLDKHVRIARWTFPIWMYVSITGVLVYVMLYQL